MLRRLKSTHAGSVLHIFISFLSFISVFLTPVLHIADEMSEQDFLEQIEILTFNAIWFHGLTSIASCILHSGVITSRNRTINKLPFLSLAAQVINPRLNCSTVKKKRHHSKKKIGHNKRCLF